MKLIAVVAPCLLALSIFCRAQTDGMAAAAPGAAGDALSVDGAVAEGLVANPEIRAAVRRLSLARLKTGTARSLDDPMLMVRDWGTPLRRPWDVNQAQTMFMLQQSFQNGQKREMNARLAGDDVAIAADEIEVLRQGVAADVRKACADLVRNADEMKLHDRQAALLKEAIAVALAQYTTGKVPEADVLRAQMALTRLNEHLVELEEEQDSARAQLNELLGRRPDEVTLIDGSYGSPAAVPSLDELERIALEHRPELAGLRSQIARSNDMGKMARLAMKPDFTVGLGYMVMPAGSSFRNAYMAELQMNLPWLNRDRHTGETRQADAARDVTQAELEARSAAVFLEIRQAQIEVRAAQRRIKLYRDTLLPQAEAAFKASTAAYQNNRAEFMSLIDSQNLLLDIETAYYKASAANDAAMALLERAIGAPIPGKPARERTSK